MSYTPHTWVNDETITHGKLNNIEEGVQEAMQSGGGFSFDLVIQMDEFIVPNSASTYTILSGDTAAAIYDKLTNTQNPVTCLVLGHNTGLPTWAPYFATIGASSVPDEVLIWFWYYDSSTWNEWPLVYDSNGVRWAG